MNSAIWSQVSSWVSSSNNVEETLSDTLQSQNTNASENNTSIQGSDGGNKLSVGGIVGVAIGGAVVVCALLCVVALIVAVIFLIIRRKKILRTRSTLNYLHLQDETGSEPL